MSGITLSNVDEVLRALRAERNEAERKDKARQEEYKKATKQYIKALQKETETFERNRPNYEKRNESFRQEVEDIMSRFRVGAFGLIKSGNILEKEVDKFNHYLLESYPKLATEVKGSLEKEKQELDLKLQTIKKNNDENQIPISHAQTQVSSLSILEIREKRRELEKDLALKPSTLPPRPEFSKTLQTPLENYLLGSSLRNRSPNQSSLDEFLTKANVPDNNLNEHQSQRSPYKASYIETGFLKTFDSSIRAQTPPPYTYERVSVPAARSFHPRSKSQLRSNILFEFEKKPEVITTTTILSPEKLTQTRRSPNKTESLQYSPYTAERETDSRISSARR